MAASGRPVRQTQAQFDAIQKRKPIALKRIEKYLIERLGSADPAVMAGFEAVPREYFHYLYSAGTPTPGDAYEDVPKPWNEIESVPDLFYRCAFEIPARERLFVGSRQLIERDVHETRQLATLVLVLGIVAGEGGDRVQYGPRICRVV